MPRVTAGLLAALVLLSGGARAEGPALETPAPDYARDGFYAGMHFMYGIPFFEDHVENGITARLPGGALIDIMPVADVDPSVGFNARVGYRFLRHFAAEVQFEWIDEFDVKILGTAPQVDPGSSGADASTIDGLTITGHLKLYPLTGRIQPYVDVGIGYMEVDSRDKGQVRWRLTPTFAIAANTFVNVNDNDLVVRFGGGVDLYLNERWGMTAGAAYVTPGGDLKKFNYLSLQSGFFYRFP